MEPTSTTSDPALDGFPEEELLLQARRRTQLQRLGVSREVAYRYADCVEYREVALLIECDWPPDLAVLAAAKGAGPSRSDGRASWSPRSALVRGRRLE
jgi:hypothetical protein